MQLSASNRSRLQEYFSHRPVRRVYVFGSYSRESATAASDIDILVELDYSVPIGMKFFLYQEELEQLLQMNVDLVSEAGLSKRIRPFVDKDKILIYDRAA